MQPIYAQDLATVIARAYLDKVAIGKAYNVAGKEPVSYFEVLQLIAENLGKKRRFINTFSLACGWFIAENFQRAYNL